jgi:predicted AAA+ superfamily ATPase
MIPVNLLEEVIADQSERWENKEVGTIRDIPLQKFIASSQITIISGIRRSGKSTLLYQISKNYKNYYYTNFDDERLINFEVDDFRNLMILFQKRYDSKVIFFDEIQNIKGWERFIRRIHDEGYKIFITGSNARLLSSELGTHLTGRYIKIELYPFSFYEILRYKNINAENKSSRNKSLLLQSFDWFLENGGFPEYIKSNDSEYLVRLYEDVIYRDLIVRYGVKNIRQFRNLSQYLMTNYTSEISYNKIKINHEFSSVTTVKEYISYLQDCYMLFELYKFDFSLKKQYVSSKKIYAIDNGLRNQIAFRINKDKGQALENMILIDLKRRGHDVYFYKTQNNYEVDFYIKDTNTFIQVCYSINDQSTLDREIRAIVYANKELKAAKNLILTYNEEKVIESQPETIEVMPTWKWFLNDRAVT